MDRGGARHPDVVAWVAQLATSVNKELDDFVADLELRQNTQYRLTDGLCEHLVTDLCGDPKERSWQLPWAGLKDRYFPAANWPDKVFLQQAIAELDNTRVPFTVVLRALELLDVDLVDMGRISMEVLLTVRTIREQTGAPNLLEVSRFYDSRGYPPEITILSWASDSVSFGGDWPAHDVVPLFIDRVEVLTGLIRTRGDHGWFHDRARLFRAAGMIPDPPDALVEVLFDLAVGTAKGDRALAQLVLDDHPETPDRLLEALSDKRSAVRAQAAQWIGRLRSATAVDALAEAIEREKHDGARAALIGALESLGRWHETDARHELELRAHRDLDKPLVAAIDWYPLHKLPVIRWADDGEQVPGVVLRWLVDQAARTKNPEPDALIRSYVRALEPSDRASLGAAVLDAWVEEDLGVRGPDDPRPVELDGYGLPATSAIAAKGLLAIGACCGGARVVDLAREYIQAFYGRRPAQGKALIAMLAWTGEPEAVQYLLHLRRRFRTEGFQTEAAVQLEALATRSGWSEEDLGDRTMPFAGLEDDGTLHLSYGARTIVATLGPDLTLGLLRDEAGLPLTELPAAGPSDDAESVAAARRTFAARGKELKALVVAQRARLVEAMCVGRIWAFADWSMYLAGHPVGRRLVERLVWMTVPGSGGDATRLFALGADGRPTGVDGVRVEIEDDACVSLAHDALVDAATAKAWVQRFSRDGVTPLFTQFGRVPYRLEPTRATDTVLNDVAGTPSTVLTLKARAARRGWQRGPTQQGARYYTFVRHFPSAGITAELEFSGTALPESDEPITLGGLTFRGPQSEECRLDRLPPVLLAECHRDLLAIGAPARGH